MEQLQGVTVRGKGFEIAGGGNDGFVSFGPFAPGEHLEALHVEWNTLDTIDAIVTRLGMSLRVFSSLPTESSFNSFGEKLAESAPTQQYVQLCSGTVGSPTLGIVHVTGQHVLPLGVTFDEHRRFLGVFFNSAHTNAVLGHVFIRMGDRRGKRE